MKRPWQIWTVFGLALAVATGIMAWLTFKAIALDRAEAAARAELDLARRQAELDDRISQALWRMDTALAPLIAQEAVRPVSVYEPILTVAGGKGKAALTQRVDAAFRKQFPKENLKFHALNVGFTFEAMMIAADAFKRAGSADGTALAEAIRKTDIAERMMVGGPIRFDAKGQNTQIASACIQNRNGEPVVVLPKAAAQMAPVYPVPAWQARG